MSNISSSLTLVSAQSLADRLESEPDFTLIDVLPAWSFQEKHLPAAVNACVYEMTFLDKVQELAPEKSRPIVVYGAGAESFDAEFAAEKLQRAGYTGVLIFKEGLEGWAAAGREFAASEDRTVEKNEPNLTEFPPGAESRAVDVEKSLIRWEGRNLASRHSGTLRFKSGTVSIAEGKITRAEFVINMHTIECTDISDQELNNVLVTHLESHDFFDVERYPEALFTMEQANVIEDATPGAENLHATGVLEMKGVPHPVRFGAVAGISAEGEWVAQGNVETDRTRWNVIYGSGRFFQKLGMHLVSDKILVMFSISCPPGE